MPSVLLRRFLERNAVRGDRLLKRRAGGEVRLIARTEENLFVGAADQTRRLREFWMTFGKTLGKRRD